MKIFHSGESWMDSERAVSNFRRKKARQIQKDLKKETPSQLDVDTIYDTFINSYCFGSAGSFIRSIFLAASFSAAVPD